MKRSWMAITLAIVFTAALAAAPALAKTTWKGNSVWPPKNHHSVGLVEFADMVKKNTNGELEIVVETGGALGYKGPELLKVVRDGLLPLSDMLISGVAGDEKVFQIVTLPFLALNFQELRTLIDLCYPTFEKTAQKWGQKILYIAPWPGAGIWTKKKITSLAEMKGLKTRTYDKNGALVMEATGATPFALPFSEVYSSLQTGVIDSVLTSSPTAVDAKFWEVLSFYQPVNITIATNMVNVNLNSFKKLPKNVQDELVKAGKAMEKRMWELVAELDREMVETCNKNGIQTVSPSKEFMADLTRITENIRAEWYNTAPPEAKTIYDQFRKKVGR